jgi:hypothetical protein
MAGRILRSYDANSTSRAFRTNLAGKDVPLQCGRYLARIIHAPCEVGDIFFDDGEEK